MSQTVDRAATKKAILDDDRVLTRYAQSRGFSAATFLAYFYKNSRLREGTPTTQAIETSLKADGYLKFKS